MFSCEGGPMDLCLTNGRIENEGEKLFRDRGDNVQWGVMRLEAMVPSWLVAQSDQPSQTWKKSKTVHTNNTWTQKLVLIIFCNLCNFSFKICEWFILADFEPKQLAELKDLQFVRVFPWGLGEKLLSLWKNSNCFVSGQSRLFASLLILPLVILLQPFLFSFLITFGKDGFAPRLKTLIRGRCVSSKLVAATCVGGRRVQALTSRFDLVLDLIFTQA